MSDVTVFDRKPVVSTYKLHQCHHSRCSVSSTIANMSDTNVKFLINFVAGSIYDLNFRTYCSYENLTTEFQIRILFMFRRNYCLTLLTTTISVSSTYRPYQNIIIIICATLTTMPH